MAKSTERIDYQKATDAIKAVYFSIGKKKAPEILFFDSPEAVIKVVRGRDKYKQQYPFYFFRRIKIELVIRPRNSIRHQLRNFPAINSQKDKPKFFSHSCSMAQLQLLSRISIQFWSRYAWFLDFAYSVLGCYHISERWEALQILVKNCGYIIPFQNICYVSDRPIELLFKNDLILHSENNPAVLFSDGYQIFAYNGIELSITY